MTDRHPHDADIVKRPDSAAVGTNCTLAQYEDMYRRSLDDADRFWAEQAARLDWFA